MGTDPLSSHRQGEHDLAAALRAEGEDGDAPARRAEMLEGAARFASGLGRGGGFGKI